VADLPETLARIADDRDWTALEALCDQHILAMEGELAARLLSVLRLVPDAELHARPRLMISWIRAYYAVKQSDVSELRPFLRHYMELGTRLAATMDIAGETSVATLVAVGTAAMIALRAQGACAKAEELGQRLTTRAAQLSPLPGVDAVPRSGWLPIQRGLTRSLMDDFPAAIELYRHAYEEATVEPITAATALNATANLAMIFAHLGHGAIARQWLDRMRRFASPSERVRFLLTAGGTIAEGWHALDRYDDASLADCLEIIGDGTKQLEVWPFMGALVFAHGLYLGDPAASLAHLGTLRLRHAPALIEQGTAVRVMRRAQVELLIATGQATRAFRVIREAGLRGQAIRTLTAGTDARLLGLAAQGSVAYIPQQQWVISTELDPTVNAASDGTGYYNIKTGAGPGNNPSANGYQFVAPGENGFGKAGGLGDIAYAAANAPIQIGNLVWFDGDHNGIQDPAEVLLPGATINLVDASGKQVATTKTDAAGEYYFGGVGAAYELTPGAKYTVQFDVCTANTSKVPSKPPATELRCTLGLAGDDRAHDSNVTPPTTGQLCKGYAPVTAPTDPGGVDHTIDAGVYIPPAPPTSTPPASTPPTSVPPTKPVPTNPNTGSLAYTGISALPEMIFFGVVLLGAGAAFVFVSRKRRAKQR
jgi:hypothetical protein